MNCPHCEYDSVPQGARFCPKCGQAVEIATRVDIRQDVEHNLGRVIGVQTETIHGDVYGGDIYQVQVYALSGAGRAADWRRFLQKNAPPYKFLSPYTARDRALFKGRATEIERAVRQIGEQRLLTVYGPLGVGKTSLLAAGVIPYLMEYGALVVQVQEYTQPLTKTVREALAASADQIPIALSDELTLPALVRTVFEATGGTLVLVLDQFERLFEPSVGDEGRATLIEGLTQALRAVEPEFLRLVVAVREEALGRLGELRDHLPDLLRSPLQLSPLSRQQAQAAIQAPLTELDYPVSYVGDLVAGQLVPDLDELTPQASGWIQPSQLQIVCHWLYQAARERRPPHVDTGLYVSEARGADGIMARYLEETLRTQLAGEQALAERILRTMASPGVGRWIPPERLPSNGDSPEQVSDVLEHLVEAELLVRHAVNGRREYAFVSHSVVQEVRRLAGAEVEQRYQAEEELERVWSAWLARDALATRGQLRFLAENGAHLAPRAVKALLLLRSAVARDTPVDTWLSWLDGDEGRALIRQLEETDDAHLSQYSSQSVLSKAAALLGLTEVDLDNRTNDQGRPFGPVARSAVSHADPVTRQTAALALMVVYRHAGLDRLGWALRASGRGRRRRAREAELRGALADADPEVEKLNADLPLSDRIRVWWWRARRRLIRDRHRVAALVLGGAIGAGLGLGLLRALLAIPARLMIGVQFAVYAYWGALLGGATGLGMALSAPLLLRPTEGRRSPPLGRAPTHPERLPSSLATGLGALAFGLANLIVALFNGLPLSAFPLVVPLGFVAGLGLAMGLWGQPRAGWRLGVKGWSWRLGAAALIFTLTHAVFILAGEGGRGISVAWTGTFYRAEFTRYVSALWPQLMENYPDWFEVLALMDAALVGIVLTLGVSVGLSLAVRWLARWRALVNRAGD